MGPASAYEYTSHKSVSLLEISAQFARAYDQAARSRTLPVESVEGALESIMQQYDTDKSGNFSAPEVKAIVRDLIQSRARNTSISRILVAIAILIVLASVAVIGLVIACNEISKENRTVGSTLVSARGSKQDQPVQVASVESFASLWDLVMLSTTTLAALERITFVYVSGTAADTVQRIETCLYVEGFSRPLDHGTDATSKTQLVILSKLGQKLVLNSETGTITFLLNGTSYNVEADSLSASSTRRRSDTDEEGEADELQRLLSQEEYLARDARLDLDRERRRSKSKSFKYKAGKVSGAGAFKVSSKSSYKPVPVYQYYTRSPVYLGMGYYYNNRYNQYPCDSLRNVTACNSVGRLDTLKLLVTILAPLLGLSVLGL